MKIWKIIYLSKFPINESKMRIETIQRGEAKIRWNDGDKVAAKCSSSKVKLTIWCHPATALIKTQPNELKSTLTFNSKPDGWWMFRKVLLQMRRGTVYSCVMHTLHDQTSTNLGMLLGRGAGHCSWPVHCNEDVVTGVCLITNIGVWYYGQTASTGTCSCKHTIWTSDDGHIIMACTLALALLSHKNSVVFTIGHIYERVAVGRKYPCSRPLWICLLWLLLQSLFHVQLGWNFNTKQPLYVQPFCLWPDENPLAWSGAIHHQKNAIILAVNTAIYMVKVVLAGS